MTKKETQDLDRFIETTREETLNTLEALDFKALDKAAKLIKKAKKEGKLGEVITRAIKAF